MLSFLKSKKAQFYVLSGFVIVAILYVVGRWIEPPTIIDTSSVARMEEPFIFNNIREKAITTVNQSKNCEDLTYNLNEYKSFIDRYALSKKLNLNFDYAISPCFSDNPTFPVVVEVKMQLLSPNINLFSNFTMFWVQPP